MQAWTSARQTFVTLFLTIYANIPQDCKIVCVICLLSKYNYQSVKERLN